MLGGEPVISGAVLNGEKRVGVVTAGATSPYLAHGVGIALLDTAELQAGAKVDVTCRDGGVYPAELVEMPFYDKAAEIPRGKRVEIPERR